MVIFNSAPLIEKIKTKLTERVIRLRANNMSPKIAAVMYREDRGSQLYTSIKKDLAESLGIGYEVFEFSLRAGVEPVLAKLKELNNDPEVTGIILQKPMRKTWSEANYLEGEDREIKKAYDLWWRLQTATLDPKKDVDGLHPSIIEVIANDQLLAQQRVLPATAKAVLTILAESKINLYDKKIAIIGKSDLLGLPLYTYFLSKKYQVEMLGSQDLKARVEQGLALLDFDVVISATGVAGLITGSMLKPGVVVVDVGEPHGDIDFASVSEVAAFLTPVPGGVGPMTVVSLMENSLELVT